MKFFHPRLHAWTCVLAHYFHLLRFTFSCPHLLKSESARNKIRKEKKNGSRQLANWCAGPNNNYNTTRSSAGSHSYGAWPLTIPLNSTDFSHIFYMELKSAHFVWPVQRQWILFFKLQTFETLYFSLRLKLVCYKVVISESYSVKSIFI